MGADRTLVALVIVAVAFCGGVTGAAPATKTPSRPAPPSTPPGDLTELTLEQLMDIEVVYAAAKHEQKSLEAPASVSVITAEDIRTYGSRSLADLLRSVRGIFGTYDRNYSYVGVRGFGRPGDDNSRILLLIDSYRINDNIYDAALVGQEFSLGIDLIERVEVVRGPSSSLYGTSAFFGVVNVITKGADEAPGMQIAGGGRRILLDRRHGGQGDRKEAQERNQPPRQHRHAHREDPPEESTD